MSWRQLLTPDYMLPFLDGLLMGALPVLGLASGITNGTGIVQPHAWPSGPAILGALLVGLMNGVRAIRNLRTTPPPEGGKP